MHAALRSRRALVLQSFDALWSTRFEDARVLAKRAGRPVVNSAARGANGGPMQAQNTGDNSAPGGGADDFSEYHSTVDALACVLCWARLLEGEVATLVALLDEQDHSVDAALALLTKAGSTAQAWEQAVHDTLRSVKTNNMARSTPPSSLYQAVLDDSSSSTSSSVVNIGVGLGRRLGWGGSGSQGKSSDKDAVSIFGEDPLHGDPRNAAHALGRSRLLARILQAEVALLSAGLHFRKSSMLKGAFSIRSAWKQYESCLRDARKIGLGGSTGPDVEPATASSPEAHPVGRGSLSNHVRSCLDFGTGLFYFFISLVPPKFLWVIEAIGFQADRERGMASLRQCWLDRGPRAPIALLLLIWIERFFAKDFRQTEVLLEASRATFPTGALFVYLDGYTRRHVGELEAGAKCFDCVREWALAPVSYPDNSAHSAAVVQCAQLGLCARYEFGWCKFLQMDWDAAAVAFADFLQNQKGASFRAYCGFQLGVCYLFLNQPQRALEVFEQVPAWIRKYYSFDAYAGRKAAAFAAELRRRLREGNQECNIDVIDLNLLAADICIEAQNASQAAAILANDLAKFFKTDAAPQSAERAVLYYYAQGRILRMRARSQVDYAAAIVALEEAISLQDRVREERFVIPHALCEIAEIYFEVRHDTGSAKNSVLLAKKFTDYDFDKPLMRRLENLLDQMRKHPTGPPAKSPAPDELDDARLDQVQEDHSSSSEEFFSAPSDAESEEDMVTSTVGSPQQLSAFSARTGKHSANLISTQLASFESDSSDSEGDDTRHPVLWDPLSLQSLDDMLKHSAERGNDAETRTWLNWARHKRMWLHGMDDVVQMARRRPKHGGVKIKDRRYRLKLYPKCFVGREFVDWLCATRFSHHDDTPICGSRQDAVAVSQLMVDSHLIHHVAASEPFIDGDFYYRFHDDLEQAELNMNRIWALPVRPAVMVVNELNRRLFNLFTDFVSSDGRSIDLRRLRSSRQFRQFSLATCELQRIDLFALSYSQKLSFFLNCYNMLMVHGNATYGVPSDSLGDRLTGRQFFDKCSYCIGGLTFSLNDIEHGILRGNSAAPGQFLLKTRPFSTTDGDARMYHVFSRRDPRIHFALNCGARSCPPLRLFLPETLDGALTWATESFLDEDVVIDYVKHTITLSKLFDWYGSDFGASVVEVLRFVVTYCSRVRELALREAPRDADTTLDAGIVSIAKTHKVKFKSYDWTSIMSLPRQDQDSSATPATSVDTVLSDGIDA